MMTMVKNAVQLASVSVVDAVRMASLNPARALSLSGRKGSIEPRRDADIVIFTPEFAVRQTLVGGRVEFEAS